jgi:hypothetical protein
MKFKGTVLEDTSDNQVKGNVASGAESSGSKMRLRSARSGIDNYVKDMIQSHPHQG